MAIKLGQTWGHVKQNVFANRIYYKPTLRKPIIRHPGVIRRSEKVLAINKRFAEIKPAVACKGLPWEKFVKCLSEQLRGKLK